MGDVLIALSAIASALVLYHRWQAGRALRRLMKLLEESGQLPLAETPPSERRDAAGPARGNAGAP